MGAYLSLIKISFKNAFAYKVTFFTSLIGIIITILAQMAVWRFVYSKDADMLVYMTNYVIISNILGILYSDRIIMPLGEKIRNGNYVMDLLKPIETVSFIWGMSSGQMLAGLFNQVLPTAVIFLPFLITIQYNIQNLLWFLVVCILNFILISLIFIIVGFLAFIVIEVWPFHYFTTETIRLLSGSIIPIALFPSWMSKLVSFTPFPFIYSFPLRIILEDLTLKEITYNLFILVIWIIVLSMVLRVIQNIAVRKSIVQGG